MCALQWHNKHILYAYMDFIINGNGIFGPFSLFIHFMCMRGF